MKNDKILKAIDEKWSRVSEVDFLMAYDDALSSISLRPQLHEQNFAQDLNVLDLKSNGGNYTLELRTPAMSTGFVMKLQTK